MSKESDYNQKKISDEGYWYHDEDVKDAIRAQIPGDDVVIEAFHIDVKKPANPSPDYKPENLLKEVMSAHAEDLRKEKSVILALNTLASTEVNKIPAGAHWLAMHISVDEQNKDKLIVKFVDSIGKSLAHYKQRSNLKEALQKLESGFSEIIYEDATPKNQADEIVAQQANGTDCGPFVVDNLVKLHNKEPITAGTSNRDKLIVGKALRKQHAGIIEKQRQAKAAPLASVAPEASKITREYHALPEASSKLNKVKDTLENSSAKREAKQSRDDFSSLQEITNAVKSEVIHPENELIKQFVHEDLTKAIDDIGDDKDPRITDLKNCAELINTMDDTAFRMMMTGQMREDSIKTMLSGKDYDTVRRGLDAMSSLDNKQKKSSKKSSKSNKEEDFVMVGQLLDRTLTPERQDELSRATTKHYAELHNKFADKYEDLQWTEKIGRSSDKTEGKNPGRSTTIKDKSNRVICELVQTDYSSSPVMATDSRGRKIKIKKYRTVNTPVKLDKKGPLALSLALMDKDGMRISEDHPAYFTAHYNADGYLCEISCPMPVKFQGQVAYTEIDGEIYTLPVTKKRYQEMLNELNKNRAKEAGLALDKVAVGDQKQQPEKKQEQQQEKPKEVEPVVNQAGKTKKKDDLPFLTEMKARLKEDNYGLNSISEKGDSSKSNPKDTPVKDDPSSKSKEHSSITQVIADSNSGNKSEESQNSQQNKNAAPQGRQQNQVQSNNNAVDDRGAEMVTFQKVEQDALFNETDIKNRDKLVALMLERNDGKDLNTENIPPNVKLDAKIKDLRHAILNPAGSEKKRFSEQDLNDQIEKRYKELQPAFNLFKERAQLEKQQQKALNPTQKADLGKQLKGVDEKLGKIPPEVKAAAERVRKSVHSPVRSEGEVNSPPQSPNVSKGVSGAGQDKGGGRTSA